MSRIWAAVVNLKFFFFCQSNINSASLAKILQNEKPKVKFISYFSWFKILFL